MSKIRSIISIIYCVLRRPEDILEAIQGKSVAANELGGVKTASPEQNLFETPGIYLWGQDLLLETAPIFGYMTVSCIRESLRRRMVRKE